jgi:hypothetical protein
MSPVGGLSGYSPFMGVPWGNNVPNYLAEPPAGHLELPSSPMSPGGCDEASEAAGVGCMIMTGILGSDCQNDI